MFCPCPLCLNHGVSVILESLNKPSQNQRRYFHCPICDLRYLDPTQRLSQELEKARYLEHNNDVDDPRYQKFVTPLIEAISPYLREDSKGLDFGAGTGPVLAKLLRERGHQINLYDPFFWPEESALLLKYDFVVSTEVVEHFYDPRKEFQTIKGLLKTPSVFGLMTAIYDDTIDFTSWYYKNDPTHVCFYSKTSLEWIGRQFGFKRCDVINDRIALFHL